VLTVLDDFSKLSVVRCLGRKADVPDFLRTVINLVETQSGRRVQRIRSDRGREFVNNSLEVLYKDRGIVRELTAGYSPESNGAAERVQRTLLECTRAMLLDSGLPKSMWGEAIMTASYIRNRVPASGTPWGLFFGQPPDVSNMRVFGCRVSITAPKVHRDKVVKMNKCGVFVGYDSSNHRVLLDKPRVL
jgi:transposase InsO family protein